MELDNRVDSGPGLVVRLACDGDIQRPLEALGAIHHDYVRSWLDEGRKPDDPSRLTEPEPCLANRGDGAFIVALWAGRLIGLGHIQWSQAVEPEVVRLLPEVPQLYHFFVRKNFRDKGVGTALLLAAENILRERGFTRVLLGVDKSNEPARRLYCRLGYTVQPELRDLQAFSAEGLPLAERYDILVHVLKPEVGPGS